MLSHVKAKHPTVCVNPVPDRMWRAGHEPQLEVPPRFPSPPGYDPLEEWDIEVPWDYVPMPRIQLKQIAAEVPEASPDWNGEEVEIGLEEGNAGQEAKSGSAAPLEAEQSEDQGPVEDSHAVMSIRPKITIEENWTRRNATPQRSNGRTPTSDLVLDLSMPPRSSPFILSPPVSPCLLPIKQSQLKMVLHRQIPRREALITAGVPAIAPTIAAVPAGVAASIVEDSLYQFALSVYSVYKLTLFC